MSKLEVLFLETNNEHVTVQKAFVLQPDLDMNIQPITMH